MVNVGIVGGTGYGGVELMRLLAAHPHARLRAVTSRAVAGTPVEQLFPNLRGVVDLRFSEPNLDSLGECEYVFLAAPSGTAMDMVPELLARGCRVIDLSADFRLRDAQEWAHWYGREHACPELLGEAVYGLPEVRRAAIRDARLVANPGCYPTAVQLGFLPLLERRLIAPDQLVADAKSGASGAGRTPKQHTLLCEAGENVHAYGASGHRHLPEIRQGLCDAAGSAVGVTFVPHLVPMVRGIHATLYAQLLDRDTDLQGLYEARFADEPFVDVMPPGSHPETRSVRGANVCRIALHRPGDGDRVVVLAVVDNLVKGAAGQAVQNMNLMAGLEETAGLGITPALP